ncbi:DNA damage-inducible protein 1, partial [Cryomyces antarcticus]
MKVKASIDDLGCNPEFCLCSSRNSQEPVRVSLPFSPSPHPACRSSSSSPTLSDVHTREETRPLQCERCPPNGPCATPEDADLQARPRITISVSAPQNNLDGELLTLDLPPGLTIADLKGFVQADTNVPTASQQFYLNGQPVVGDTKTIEEAGIKDGEMLAML